MPAGARIGLRAWPKRPRMTRTAPSVCTTSGGMYWPSGGAFSSAAAGAKSDAALAGAYRRLLQSCNVVHLRLQLRCLRRDICSGPGGEGGGLAARDLVREGNPIARIRTEVRVGLEISECLRYFARAGEQVGEDLLWDLLE